MLRHVVLVEDDHMQEGLLADYLQDSVPDLTIETVTTESEFRNKLPDFRKQPPDLVIMDMMLRWAVPRLSMPDPPPEVLDGGYYRAGLRCIDLLRQDELLKTSRSSSIRSSNGKTSLAIIHERWKEFNISVRAPMVKS